MKSMHKVSFFVVLGVVSVVGFVSSLAQAATPATPPGYYTGGLFAQYFTNIVSVDGSSGLCPPGYGIVGFNTEATSSYGTPICAEVAGYWKKINNDLYYTGGKVFVGTNTGIADLSVSGSIAANIYYFNNGGPEPLSGWDTDFTWTRWAAHISNTNAGNVGIGVLSPSQKLDVLGYVNASSGYCIGGSCISTWSVSQSQWGSSGSSIYYTGSNVGIGTSSPSQKLDVLGYVNASSGYCIGGSCISTWSVSQSQWGSSGSSIYYTGSNVGIGTSSPSQKLDVIGNTRSTNHMLTAAGGNGLCFWNDCTNYKISMGNAAEYLYGPVTDYSIKNTMSNTAGRGWTWGTPGAAPVAALNTAGTMQIAGSLGIGATPAAKLTTVASAAPATIGTEILQTLGRSHNSGISWENAVSFAVGRYYVSDTNPNTRFDISLKSTANNTMAGDVTVMSMQSDGKVGIGTTSPTATLTVSGNIIANTPTASNHVATKAYVDSILAAGGGLSVYKNDGTTLLGKFLQFQTNNDLIYSDSNGTVIVIGSDHRSASHNYSWYRTTNCTGTEYAAANYDWNSGNIISSPSYYSHNDGVAYLYTTFNTSTLNSGSRSYWNHNTSTCVNAGAGNVYTFYYGPSTKICGLGDCKIK